MRIRRVGSGSEFRLLQDEQEIGNVDGTRVSFRGFAARDDAAQAASINGGLAEKLFRLT